MTVQTRPAGKRRGVRGILATIGLSSLLLTAYLLARLGPAALVRF